MTGEVVTPGEWTIHPFWNEQVVSPSEWTIHPFWNGQVVHRGGHGRAIRAAGRGVTPGLTWFSVP